MLRLKPKLVLALTPIIIAPLMILGYMAYINLQRQYLQQIHDELQEKLTAVAEEFARQNSSARANAQLLGNSHFLREHFFQQHGPHSRSHGLDSEISNHGEEELHLQFAAYQKAAPHYNQFQLIAPTGELLLQHPTSQTQEAAKVWFHKIPERQIQQLQKNRQDGKHYLLIAQPVFPLQPDSAPLGYLALSMKMPAIERAISEERIGQRGFMMLVRSSGEIINSSSKEPIAPKQVRRALQSDEATINQQYHGQQAWLSSQRQLMDDVFLVAFWPLHEAKTTNQRSAIEIAIIILMAIIATAWLIFWAISRLVISPVQQLDNAAKQIGLGKHEPSDWQLNSKDELGQLAETLGTMSLNLQATTRKLQHIAYHDNLTGLANRHLFRQYLDIAISHAQRNQQKLALLFIDIDGFKEVNDQLGHRVGDDVLKAISQRLSHCLRDEDMIALRHSDESPKGQWDISRIGGDEFTAILEVQREEDASQVSERILEVLNQPFDVEQQAFHLGASIGIAIYPDDAGDADTLLKHSDIAMYQAKSLRKNNYAFFDGYMTERSHQRHQLLNELRGAIQTGQLELHYQPQLEAGTERLVGCEALVRWRHPEQGMISPAEFIPLAEESGLIVPLGEWVLKRACQQLSHWRSCGYPTLVMAVNFSTLQFRQAQRVEKMVARVLEETQLPPHLLDVEITETAVMENSSNAISTLNAILAMGVNISMDDFGTGYSSLAALRELPLHKLKIDKSFIDGINISAEGDAIIKAILAMAKQIGLTVVAEGVEERHQMDFLHQQGCEIIQGYLVSRPLPESQMTELLAHLPRDGHWPQNQVVNNPA